MEGAANSARDTFAKYFQIVVGQNLKEVGLLFKKAKVDLDSHGVVLVKSVMLFEE
jgi:hypothetical protein